MDVCSKIDDGTLTEETEEEKASSISAPTQMKDSDTTGDDAPTHINNPNTTDIESTVEEDYPPIYMHYSKEP